MSLTHPADKEVIEFLVRAGLAQPFADLRLTPLAGGVSCDVWQIMIGKRFVVVKRALPRLRVAKCWEAPITRSEAEWNWLKFAKSVVPNAVPHALAHDAQTGMMAIDFLDPQLYPVWKQQLFGGAVDSSIAATVAKITVHIHTASAGNPEVAAQFPTRNSFYALRIEPYLLEAARQNPIVSASLNELAEKTLQTEIALVHGDLSPKNILVGPEGPVILDAETAWYGDPAFDVAFCLNHLLLKCMARPQFADAYLSCFEAFYAAYIAGVSWEKPEKIATRAARLLPALLLARVDGKSPVEYLSEANRVHVRNSAIELLREPRHISAIAQFWRDVVRRLDAEQPRAG